MGKVLYFFEIGWLWLNLNDFVSESCSILNTIHKWVCSDLFRVKINISTTSEVVSYFLNTYFNHLIIFHIFFILK